MNRCTELDVILYVILYCNVIQSRQPLKALYIYESLLNITIKAQRSRHGDDMDKSLQLTFSAHAVRECY